MERQTAEALFQLLGGYFSRQSIPVGVSGLVQVTAGDLGHHRRFRGAMDAGILALRAGDPQPLQIVNSLLGTHCAADALSFLEDLRKEYLERYQSARTAKG